jgi:hypothetical protein
MEVEVLGRFKGIDKDTRKVLKALEEAGFVIRRAKSGHPMVYKDDVLISTFSGTASDSRAFRNSLAPLKRAGFEWPPRR